MLDELQAALASGPGGPAPIAFVDARPADVAERLAASPEVPVVAVAAAELDVAAERALVEAGAIDVLVWPRDRDRLPARLVVWRRWVQLAHDRAHAQARVGFLYDRMPAMLHSIDAAGLLISVSDTWLERLGYTRDEVLGRRSTDFLVPASQRLAVERGPEFMRTGLATNVEYQFRAKNGSAVDVLLSAVAERDEAGDLVRAIAYSADVTAQRKLAHQLVDADAMLSNILNNVPDPLFVKDEQHRFIAFSQSFCDIMGRRADELLGRSDDDFFPADEAAEFRAKDSVVFASGQTNENEESFTDAQGIKRVIATKKAMFTDGHGRKVLVGIIRDLTERKRLEAQLSQTERMASVGTLAAGVAHEINNPLAYVLGNIEFVRGALRESPIGLVDDVVDALTEAAEGASRIRDIVRDMKTFSQPAQERLQRVEVVDSINLAVRMVSNQLRHVARVVLDLAPGLAVSADQSRLGQVMINLLVNAIQAFEAPGDPANQITITSAQIDGEILILVRDNASGVPPAVVGRIFDPFFTTKPVGVGTGLGLAICHGIVTALGGRIAVESKLGVGTTVRVTLPPWAPGATQTAVAALGVAAVGPRARVMIIEDDVLVARSFQRNLSRDCDVTVHHDASEALEALLGDAKVDLILCDLMMPGMSGQAFYEELSTRAPPLCSKLAFVTGGAFTPKSRHFIETTSAPTLYKPASPEDLRRFVMGLLGARRS